MLNVAKVAQSVDPNTTAMAAGTTSDDKCPCFRIKLMMTKVTAPTIPMIVVGSMKIAPVLQ